jgi:hypothetical protein
VRVVPRDAAIPGRSQISQAKDSVKAGKTTGTETFASNEDGSIWKRFMRKVMDN